jgi:hypothetical protein
LSQAYIDTAPNTTPESFKNGVILRGSDRSGMGRVTGSPSNARPARYAEAKCHTNKPAHLGVASTRVIGVLMANVVSGPPPYVTAHRISVTDGELEFETAYLFTTLIMSEHGGPRPIKARDKKLYFELAGKGWVRMEGESLFADDSITKVVWNHVHDVFADPEERYPVIVTTPPKTVGSKKDKWWAIATKEGVDRVYKAWCDYHFSNQ